MLGTFLLFIWTLSVSGYHEEDQRHGIWEFTDIAARLTDLYEVKNDLDFVRMNVKLESHIQQIVSLSSISGQFLVDLFFSEIWTDPKLNFKYLNLCTSNVTLSAEFENVPGICVANAKFSATHHSPKSNDFLILYVDGTAWRNYRMRIGAPCQFRLSVYPFDEVICELIFQSFLYQTDEVTVHWLEHEPVTIMGTVYLPDYELYNYTLYTTVDKYKSSEFDQARIPFLFKRKFGYVLLQTYTPSAVTVAVSWITFMFDPKSTSARVTIGVSSLLALSFQFIGAEEVPRVSQLKGTDVCLLICICFIFLSLAEFAFFSNIMRIQKRNTLKRYMDHSRDQPKKPSTSWLLKLNVAKVDSVSLWAYPLLFTLCNVIYWNYYLTHK